MVVVEDSPEMRIIISRILKQDHRLQMEGDATTAEGAVEVARSSKPDLVVLDHFIEGPVLGLEAAPLIKAASPNTKILLFSDFDLKAQSAKEPAVDRFLPKKRMSELLQTVQEMLALGRGPDRS